MLTLPLQETVKKRGIMGWMLFDLAAQPFFTVIITFIFGPYFVSRLAENAVTGQAAWGYTITISGVVLALFAPILGSIADATGRRKRWILVFAVVKVLALLSLWWAAPGSSLLLPAIAIIVATLAAEFSIVFNDSLLPQISTPQTVGKISNLAWGLGYLGGLAMLFLVLLFLSADPVTGKTLLGASPWFGLDALQGEDARVTGPLSALWYVVFLLPMFLFTPDRGAALPLKQAVKAGLRELKHTWVEVKTRVSLFRFLIARMLYQDGVNGLLALGGTFAAAMFGWQTLEMGIYGILLLVAAIIGCAGAAWLDRKVGSRILVLWALFCLTIACVGIISTGEGYTLFGWITFSAEAPSEGLFASTAEKVYVLYGLFIGLAFGPVQASSRALLAKQITPEESGRYYGLYALSGRVTSAAAPFLVATVTLITESARWGMSMLIVFLALGFIALWMLKIDETGSSLAVRD